MESKLYACPRYGKNVKSTSGLTRHINACKIPLILPSCQTSTPAPILKYNTTNHSDLPSNYFEEDISPRTSNNNEVEIRPADTRNNDDKNSRAADIDKPRSKTPNWTPRNRLLSELSWNSREVTFRESEFPVNTPILDTRYMHLES